MSRGVMRLRGALVIAIVVAAAPASAGTYRRVAPDGTVSYSDQPPPVSTTPAPAPSAEPAVAPPPPVETARPAVVRPATIEELLELSGATRQLRALAPSLATEFKAPASFSPRERAAVERIAARQFQSDRLLATVADELRRRRDQASLDAVAAWLRSPLGRKITALEVQASREPEAERLASGPTPAPARATLIEQLDWLAGITESRLDGMLAVARATATSIAAALPADQRKTPAQIDRDLQRARAQMRPQVEQATVQYMLRQYRSLDDAELLRFAAFLSSAPGRWYSAASSRALSRAISVAATETARAMVAAVPAERWRELAMAPAPSSTSAPR